MFAETGADFALWGDIGEPLPETGKEPLDDLENLLPVSDSLRSRLLEWAAQYCRYDGGDRDIDMSDFDERGLHLSRELQRELGPKYAVDYGFTYAGSRERLLPTVAADPCLGWRAH